MTYGFVAVAVMIAAVSGWIVPYIARLMRAMFRGCAAVAECDCVIFEINQAFPRSGSPSTVPFYNGRLRCQSDGAVGC